MMCGGVFSSVFFLSLMSDLIFEKKKTIYSGVDIFLTVFITRFSRVSDKFSREKWLKINIFLQITKYLGCKPLQNNLLFFSLNILP